MAKTTKFMSLIKPEASDNIDPTVFANNFQKIDDTCKDLNSNLKNLIEVESGSWKSVSCAVNQYATASFDKPSDTNYDYYLFKVSVDTSFNVHVISIGTDSAKVFNANKEDGVFRLKPYWLAIRKTFTATGSANTYG